MTSDTTSEVRSLAEILTNRYKLLKNFTDLIKERESNLNTDKRRLTEQINAYNVEWTRLLAKEAKNIQGSGNHFSKEILRKYAEDHGLPLEVEVDDESGELVFLKN